MANTIKLLKNMDNLPRQCHFQPTTNQTVSPPLNLSKTNHSSNARRCDLGARPPRLGRSRRSSENLSKYLPQMLYRL